MSKKVFTTDKSAYKLHLSGIAISVAVIFYLAGILGAILLDLVLHIPDGWIGAFVVVMILIGLYLMFSIQVASQWEKAIVLRFGKFYKLAGPGLFWIFPIIDTTRQLDRSPCDGHALLGEETLTKDTVPVDVDAVLFWMVWDAKKAALEVENYRSAIAWAAETALREIIGQMSLADILIGRAKMDDDLQKIIDERTTPWGVTVQSVRIRDVVIPQDLEDTMSRQAQAERERQARVIWANPKSRSPNHSQRRLSLHHQPDRPAPACHEHALRGPEKKAPWS